MKKLLSSVIAASALLSCFGTMGVMASEEPTIYISTDKSKWEEISMSKFTGSAKVNFLTEGTKDSKVYANNGKVGLDITDSAQFVYMYAEVPEGASCDFYTTIDTSQDQEPWGSLVDGGVWALEKLGPIMAYPTKAGKSGTPQEPIAVPLRLGRVDVIADYKEGGDEKVYKLSLNGRWTAIANNPTLSDKNSGFRVYAGDAAGYMVLMGGASLANDNQSFLYTYSKYRIGNSPANWDEKNVWVGANFSKWLEGSSYVIMPGEGLEKINSVYNDTEKKYFDLTTESSYSWMADDKSAKISGTIYTDKDGYAGEVVMLMAYDAGDDSVYKNPSSGWECVNDGTHAPDKATILSKPRDYNDYTETDYYGMAIQWKNGTKSLRAEDPGISGTLSSSSYNNAVELKYAYRKKFKPGETVSVYSPGNIGGTSDGYGLSIPIIKYYQPEETAKVQDVEAMYVDEANGVMVNATTVVENYSHSGQLKAIYALYDENGKLSGVSKTATTTSDEFLFPCTKAEANNASLKVFLTDESGNPIFSSNLSKILIRTLDD